MTPEQVEQMNRLVLQRVVCDGCKLVLGRDRRLVKYGPFVLVMHPLCRDLYMSDRLDRSVTFRRGR
jgi:hypothetical protein